MSTTGGQRSPKSRRQSLFYHDLASSPISSGRGSKLNSRGHAAAVSSFSNSDLPPPPSFTLEDRSPECGISDYPLSPKAKSDPNLQFSSQGEASSSNAMFSGQSQVSWWTLPGRSGGGEVKEKAPVEGALITVLPPREVARPEIEERNSSPVGNLNEEEWVTVYGFSPGHINLVLREFDKCGLILKHIPGPRNANWMHILYQNRSDAHKALNKNRMQINGVLIVGVKRVGPAQQQTLNESLNNPTPTQRMQEMKTNKENTHVKVKDLGNALWVLFNSLCFTYSMYVGIDLVSGWVLEKYKIDYRLLRAMSSPIIIFHQLFAFLMHRRYRGMSYRLVGCQGRAVIEVIILVCAIVLRMNFPYDGNDFRKIGLLILVTFQVHSWSHSLHLSWDICLEDALLHALMEIGTYMTGQSTCIFLVFLFSGLVWIRFKYYWVSDSPEAIKKHLE